MEATTERWLDNKNKTEQSFILFIVKGTERKSLVGLTLSIHLQIKLIYELGAEKDWESLICSHTDVLVVKIMKVLWALHNQPIPHHMVLRMGFMWMCYLKINAKIMKTAVLWRPHPQIFSGDLCVVNTLPSHHLQAIAAVAAYFHPWFVSTPLRLYRTQLPLRPALPLQKIPQGFINLSS